MHWRIASAQLNDARVHLAVAMARVMAPRGLVVTGAMTAPPPDDVVACLREVGLEAAGPVTPNGPPDMVVFIANASDASTADVDGRNVQVLAVPSPSPGDADALRACRERLREHLRRLMARREDRPADPEASPGWVRDVDRQPD